MASNAASAVSLIVWLIRRVSITGSIGETERRANERGYGEWMGVGGYAKGRAR